MKLFYQNKFYNKQMLLVYHHFCHEIYIKSKDTILLNYYLKMHSLNLSLKYSYILYLALLKNLVYTIYQCNQ